MAHGNPLRIQSFSFSIRLTQALCYVPPSVPRIKKKMFLIIKPWCPKWPVGNYIGHGCHDRFGSSDLKEARIKDEDEEDQHFSYSMRPMHELIDPKSAKMEMLKAEIDKSQNLTPEHAVAHTKFTSWYGKCPKAETDKSKNPHSRTCRRRQKASAIKMKMLKAENGKSQNPHSRTRRCIHKVYKLIW